MPDTLTAVAFIAMVWTAASMGLSGACHAVILHRLDRPGPADRVIAAFGVASLVVTTAAIVSVVAAPNLARILILLGMPAWVLGLGYGLFLCVALGVQLWRPKAVPRCVVVLGAALRGREPSPLLARRVRQGAAVWHSLDEGARIVVSGGQGHDEVVSEARAMAEYLIAECGVPAAAIVQESRSTSTAENLRFTLAAVGADAGPFVVVTSDYHVPRTRMLMLATGMRGTTAASHSRPSYRPGAFVREYLAGVSGSPALRAILIGVSMLAGVAGVVSIVTG